MILIASSVFPPEPVVSANISFDLAESLSKHRKVTVLTPPPTRPFGFRFNDDGPKSIGFTHVVIPSFTYPPSKLVGRLRESYSFGKHVRSYIRKHHHGISCVYLHSWPLFGQMMIVKAACQYGIPVVTHVVDIYPEALTGKLPFFERLANRLLLPLDKYALQHSTKIVTISPKMKEHLEKTRMLEEKDVEIVYNWQNEDIFLNFRSKGPKESHGHTFTFMFLGNLSRTAALHHLIHAFAEARLDNDRLVIAGNGSQKESLMQLAKGYPDCQIEFWDAPMQMVPELQTEADVLLLSLHRGAARFALPSKLPAYMFSEKPILATVDAESDSAAIIEMAACGWVVPPEDVSSLAVAFRKAASSPEPELQNLGSNGFRFAMENFSRKGNLQKFTSLIESVIV